EDPETVNVSKVGAHDRPHIGRPQQRPPRYGRRLLDLRLFDVALFVDAANMFEFRTVHQSVLLWQVAVGEVPPHGPEDAHGTADVKHPAPSERRHDQHHNRRCNRCSEAARAVSDPLDETALLAWIPELHGAGCSRKCAGFANPEKKANDHSRIAYLIRSASRSS